MLKSEIMSIFAKYSITAMKKTLTILFLLLALTACNNSDDINEIFQNRTWTLSFFDEAGLKTSTGGKNYTIEFTNEIFTLTTPSGAVISGNWSAKADSRQFTTSNIRILQGSIAGDGIAQKMKSFLENATSYGGDANYLQIKINSKTYMQFYNR